MKKILEILLKNVGDNQRLDCQCNNKNSYFLYYDIEDSVFWANPIINDFIERKGGKAFYEILMDLAERENFIVSWVNTNPHRVWNID